LTVISNAHKCEMCDALLRSRAAAINSAESLEILILRLFADRAALSRPWEWADRERWVKDALALVPDAASGVENVNEILAEHGRVVGRPTLFEFKANLTAYATELRETLKAARSEIWDLLHAYGDPMSNPVYARICRTLDASPQGERVSEASATQSAAPPKDT
jgi:hypothetical protein